jgi:hypothetical protein
MLKLFFWLLLIGNGVLFAMQRGYVGAATPERHEPQRLAQQLQPQTLSILPADSEKLKAPVRPAVPADAGQDGKGAEDAAKSDMPASMQADAKPAAPPAPTPKPPVKLIACTEIGNFNSVEMRRFEAQLAALHLPVKATAHSVQEVSSYMVYIPSQEGKDGADRRSAELRRLGIQDFYVMPESQANPALRWAISLGVFKTEEAAKAYIGQLIPQGVRSARIMARNLSSSRQAYQWRNIDPATKAALDALADKFPGQEQRACGS